MFPFQQPPSPLTQQQQQSPFKPQAPLNLPQQPSQRRMSTEAYTLKFLCGKGLECILGGMADIDQVVAKTKSEIRGFVAAGYIGDESLALGLVDGAEFGVLLCLLAGLDASDMAPYVRGKYRCSPEDVISRLATTGMFDSIINRNRALNAFRLSVASKVVGQDPPRAPFPDMMFPPSMLPDGQSTIFSANASSATAPRQIQPRHHGSRKTPYKDPRGANISPGAYVFFRRMSQGGSLWYEYFDCDAQNRYPIFLHRRIANALLGDNYKVCGRVVSAEKVLLSEPMYELGVGDEMFIVDMVEVSYSK